MKKWCVLVSALKTFQKLYRFMGYVGIITFFSGQLVALAKPQKSYPCIAAQSCETGECDSIIQKITVDYYDDFGNPYRVTHKVNIDEGLIDCEAAISRHAHEKYKACEEQEEILEESD